MKTIEYTESLNQMGFTLEVLSGPTGKVQEGWPCIEYTVRLSFHGKEIITTQYKLGVGHVDPKKARIASWGLTVDEHQLFEHWQSNPRTVFRDKELWANTAAKIAKAQKVVPNPPDVLHSLLSDGQAFFSAMRFEDWAAEYGYSPDSRKAEEIYRACDDIGRKLSVIPSSIREQATELLSNL